MEESRISRLIDTAIRREEEAHAFYTGMKDQIGDPDVKDTIAWIAGEEKKHREFLIRYRDGGFSPEALKMSDVTYYKIAEHQEAPEVEKDMKTEDVYLVAAHRELNSHRFYQELAGTMEPGETREMLLRMANEELRHKEKMEYLYSNTAFPQTSGG